MKIRPLHDRVVIKRLEAEEKTASGIVLPGWAKWWPWVLVSSPKAASAANWM